MDAKKKIRIDSAAGPVGDEECIDISIAFTPACSLYMVLTKGLKEVEMDVNSMVAGLSKIPSDQKETIEALRLQLTVAKLAYQNGKKFLTELSRVIEELTPPEQKKVLIHRPPTNWKP